VTSPATVEGSERVRLFCALQLPDRALDELVAWQAGLDVSGAAAGRPSGAYRLVPRDNLHVTLAFLGARPAAEVETVVGELRAAAAEAEPVSLRPVGYRETRSVGMLVCDDLGGAAARLAVDLQQRLARRGVYELERRQWLPHVTVVRFRRPPGLRPGTLPERMFDRVVRCALYRSVLARSGAAYQVMESVRLGTAQPAGTVEPASNDGGGVR
jgi:2'-5' RNA ligase